MQHSTVVYLETLCDFYSHDAYVGERKKGQRFFCPGDMAAELISQRQAKEAELNRPMYKMARDVLPRINTAAVIASGPSLTDEQVDYLCVATHNGRLDATIAINDNYLKAPWATVLYACDKRWIDWHTENRKYEMNRVRSIRVTQDQIAACTYDDWFYVPSVPTLGLGMDWVLRQGGNSGHQAINLAALMGAKKIILVGFDMSDDGPKKHWFGDHPTKEMNTGGNFSTWNDAFFDMAESCQRHGIDVVNCTERTELRHFRREKLWEAV